MQEVALRRIRGRRMRAGAAHLQPGFNLPRLPPRSPRRMTVSRAEPSDSSFHLRARAARNILPQNSIHIQGAVRTIAFGNPTVEKTEAARKLIRDAAALFLRRTFLRAARSRTISAFKPRAKD